MNPMTVEAMGGPYDGWGIVVPEAVRQIEFLVEPSPADIEVARSFHNHPNPPMPISSVVYDVVEWYGGRNDRGEAIPIKRVVIAPDRWPTNPSDSRVYPPDQL